MPYLSNAAEPRRCLMMSLVKRRVGPGRHKFDSSFLSNCKPSHLFHLKSM